MTVSQNVALPNKDQFLTTAQKAKQLQVSYDTVRRNRVALGGFKVGNRWRFTWDVPSTPLTVKPYPSGSSGILPNLSQQKRAEKELDDLLAQYAPKRKRRR